MMSVGFLKLYPENYNSQLDRINCGFPGILSSQLQIYKVVQLTIPTNSGIHSDGWVLKLGRDIRVCLALLIIEIW